MSDDDRTPEQADAADYRRRFHRALVVAVAALTLVALALAVAPW